VTIALEPLSLCYGLRCFGFGGDATDSASALSHQWWGGGGAGVDRFFMAWVGAGVAQVLQS
jgi:hypothetical protein